MGDGFDLLEAFGGVRRRRYARSSCDRGAGTFAESHAPLRTAASAQETAAIAALRKREKYVFVLYQENRSFDSYFGTFPGAEGIYTQPASETLGYTQEIERSTARTGRSRPSASVPPNRQPTRTTSTIRTPA
jgi:phospholipase C